MANERHITDLDRKILTALSEGPLGREGRPVRTGTWTPTAGLVRRIGVEAARIQYNLRKLVDMDLVERSEEKDRKVPGRPGFAYRLAAPTDPMNRVRRVIEGLLLSVGDLVIERHEMMERVDRESQRIDAEKVILLKDAYYQKNLAVLRRRLEKLEESRTVVPILLLGPSVSSRSGPFYSPALADVVTHRTRMLTLQAIDEVAKVFGLLEPTAPEIVE